MSKKIRLTKKRKRCLIKKTERNNGGKNINKKQNKIKSKY